MPSEASRCGRTRVSGFPCQLKVPADGFTNPQMTLNSVVFPAPLGPMTPRTSPLETDSETPSRAMIPPKDTEISFTASTPSLSSPVGTAPRYTSSPPVPMVIHDMLRVLNTATRNRLPRGAPGDRLCETSPGDYREAHGRLP